MTESAIDEALRADAREGALCLVGTSGREEKASGLDSLYAPEFMLNSPANRLQSRQESLDLVASGGGWFSRYDRTVEAAYQSGDDVVVIMGREVVIYEDFGTPYDGKLVHRRFTNAWRRVGDEWRQFLRHASTERVED